jgi:hypothetical protein
LSEPQDDHQNPAGANRRALQQSQPSGELIAQQLAGSPPMNSIIMLRAIQQAGRGKGVLSAMF